FDSDTPSEDVGKTVVALPELPPNFFIPRLDDKPQNPIMDTLRILQKKPHSISTSAPPAPSLPPELALLSGDLLKFAQARQSNLEDIWQSAALLRHGHVNHVLSWDVLRPSFNTNVDPSPFLSEQSTNRFASARYHLRPPIQDLDVHLVYTQVPELFQSLLLTVNGTSSHLHIWNPILQRFALRGLQEKQRGRIVIVGKDEIATASLLKRFLTIGNLMRRLEILTEIRSSSRHHPTNQPTPTLHAFTHALSSILAHLRQTAETISPDVQASPGGDARLIALWTRYEDMESVLQALAALCGREETLDPADFNPIPTAPNALLSAIYHHLADHLERSSSRVVTASLAFVLTTTSRGYIESLCASVGYITPRSQTHPAFARSRVRSDDRLPSAIPDDENEYGADRPEDDLDLDTDRFPEFIQPEVAEVFTRSRKSLVLLRAADPEHPLLTSKRLHPEIEWLWTEEQLDNMDDVLSFGSDPLMAQSQPVKEPGGPSDSTVRTDVLSSFKVFDFLPGETSPSLSTHRTANLLSTVHSTATIRTFLTAFPSSLPPSTPTLSHLTTRILAPLIAHAHALSGALVTRFLSPATHLHLHTHLVLLRGYMLITSHAFKSRLQDALFSHSEDVSTPVVGSRMYAAGEARELPREERAKLRTRNGHSSSRSRAASGAGEQKQKQTQNQGKRIVGLSSALTIGDKWPPLGSDLNFLLRTVVVDALEDGRAFSTADGDEGVEDEKAKAQRRIVEEAGWRLGFAIRDLPIGTGREKWLNPFGQALDFLYMHYQPPYPLDVLITPAILSKYHRMFAFNLRLMRIENVVRTLFRLTRNASVPLFPTLTPSNKLLLHFRFVVHAFIMALSSYVYDVAIGSNMDTFLARLGTAAEPELAITISASASANEREPAAEAFADVFSLGEYHSRVLDDVLSSCLLRSGQKAVGDILRQCMECVLELGVLAGELRDGNLEEYEAAPLLEDLWSRFRAKMTTFVKVLKALVEKEADGAGLVLSDIPLHMMHGARRVSGTTANLHQLLLRLNMSEWWTRKASS
ncbi:Spc98 family-domain-containing protein, partial [Ganoderma leucocontextum]